MTSYAKDPVTGAPLFRDSDAPDVKQDPQEAAEYAAQVGTRLIGTTAERVAYPYAREGLAWYDTDLNADCVHTGSGWVIQSLRPLNNTFPPTFIQHGQTAVTSDATGYFDVNFPVAFPNSCDRVIATSASPGTYFGGVAINGRLTNKFSARISLNSAALLIDWFAVGR